MSQTMLGESNMNDGAVIDFGGREDCGWNKFMNIQHNKERRDEKLPF